MTVRRTEMQHALAPGLHALPPEAVLARLLDGQRAALDAVEAALPALAAAADVAVRVLRSGGRVGYAGAGSSGMIALMDARELAGTFGIGAEQTPVLMAGGMAALQSLSGAVEDEAARAEDDLAEAGIVAGDAIICVAASGSTPYTLALAAAARAAGASVIGIANAEGGPLLAAADVPVLLDSGPEMVAGSTRLAAGTAQKIALNLISTLAGVRLGHVHDGYMVNVVASNAKLRDRAARIVAAVAGTDETAARAALETAHGAVKPAILIAAGARDRAHADQLLVAADGHVEPALAALRAG